jgi:hypothetical protein
LITFIASGFGCQPVGTLFVRGIGFHHAYINAVKSGDYVRFDSLPPGIEGLSEESQRVFRFCVGRVYRIDEIDAQGLLVLDVSSDIDARFGGYMNDIRVEPRYVTLAGAPSQST